MVLTSHGCRCGSRERTVYTLLQLVGAAGLIVLVIVHVCEALALFPSMRCGDAHSVGHYLDFASAPVDLTLFPLGYLFQVVTASRTGWST
jgi:hypothetical protein